MSIHRASVFVGILLLTAGLVSAALLLPMGPEFWGHNDLIVRAPAAAPSGMVWIPGGEFVMGTAEVIDPSGSNPDRIKQDEFPAHDVEIDGFYMDESPVTNRQFAEFVEMTGYVTFAERQLTKEDFAARGTDVSSFPTGAINPGSMCFNPAFDRKQLVVGVPLWENQVWKIVEGADWRHPDGPESEIQDRLDHPVVHVAWEDAQAYCEWAGKRLPTEAEFEYAARSGGKDVKYPWGAELAPGGTFQANYWQGEFPTRQTNDDGHLVTSPVKTYPPNALGLYDMAGNVWEWCSDFYAADYYARSPRRNPQGPMTSFDPLQPGTSLRVQRGGSFLCNYNNCTGYRTRARGRGDVASSSYHNGFRGVVGSAMLPEFRRAQHRIEEWKKTRTSAESLPPGLPERQSAQ